MLAEEKLKAALDSNSRKAIDIKEHEIGIIESLEPFQINVGGLILTDKNLIINYDLLEHTEYFKSLTGTIGDKSETISNGSILFENKLNKDDKVIVRPISKNKYYVSSKVKVGESNV